MTKFEITRAFDHKAFGRVGVTEIVAQVGSIAINGKELPKASVEYLLTFAMQNLQDAYAGADSAADAKARWEKKLDRLIEGTIGVRAAGDGASALQRAIRAEIGDMLRAAKKWKDVIGALDEADRPARLDEIFDKQAESVQADIRAKAEARIAEAEERKRQAAKLANAIEL